jgi:ribulose-phosphate 3-epimerase
MIIPALLTSSEDQLIEMGKICSSFCNYVQLDIMDGIFVPSKSIDSTTVENWRPQLDVEAHLMVVDPIAWIEPFFKIGAKKIIYHFEIEKDHNEIIEAIKKKGIKPALAIKPQTTINDFAHLVPLIDSVLLMSVNPGFYGAEFMPEVLDKIADFKKQFPTTTIAIDGGIKLDNARQAKEAGADCICVGSAILKSENPKQAYDNFVETVYG